MRSTSHNLARSVSPGGSRITRVVFMTALHRGGNRYEIRFEPIADFSLAGGVRAERDARVREAVRAYVSRLEHHARSAPDNWFNFFPFWDR